MLEQKYIDRFWTYVKIAGPDDCWEWTAAKTKKMKHGYFNIRLNGEFKQIGAHKVSLMIQGITIPKGLVVMHICDNPSCVNPAHLQIGTYKDNSHDMIQKGRNVHVKGENHRLAIITEDIARKIKSEIVIITDIPGRKTKKTNYSQLAKKYNVPRHIVDGIGNNLTWKHIII